MPFPPLHTALAAALLLLVASGPGCATRGASFDREQVTRIQRGITTQEEVARWFGEPPSVQAFGSGRTLWRYVHEETRTRSTGTLTKIGRSLASIFRWRVFFPPVDVAVENTVRQELEVFFDRDGIVVDHRYARTEIPSRRVY